MFNYFLCFPGAGVGSMAGRYGLGWRNFELGGEEGNGIVRAPRGDFYSRGVSILQVEKSPILFKKKKSLRW